MNFEKADSESRKQATGKISATDVGNLPDITTDVVGPSPGQIEFRSGHGASKALMSAAVFDELKTLLANATPAQLSSHSTLKAGEALLACLKLVFIPQFPLLDFFSIVLKI
jgi:hypothetical protein